MNNTVAIILSVYNGEKYVGDQLKSLVNQSYKNIEVFIHDDGSCDNSLKIIKEYDEKYNNVHLVPDAKGLGYPKCFISLLRNVEGYRYYAFCDQDDVWHTDKIEHGVKCLSEYNFKVPLLYYSAVEYCDANLNHIRDSRFAADKKRIEELDLQSLLFGGEAMGMTFLFNDVARKELLNANDFVDNVFKDWFLKLYCATCGKVFYNPKPSAKYRRHDNAVTNNSNPANKFGRYKGQIMEVFFSENSFVEQKRIIEFIKTYSSDAIKKNNEILIELFSEPNTMRKRIKKVFWPYRFRNRLLDELGYRFAFAIGKI